MGFRRTAAWPLVILLGLVWPGPAAAQPDEERILTGPDSAKSEETEIREIRKEDYESFMSLAVGFKAGAGGNLWSSSANVPAWPLVPFDGMAGGWSAGGGLFLEFRAVWDYIGLEFDVMFERCTTWTEITHAMIENNIETDWAKTKWMLEWTNVRLPLLFKAYAPIGWVRMSFAIGPEFVVGMGANAEFSYLELDRTVADPAFIDEATEAGTKNFHAKIQTDTYLCVGLGLLFELDPVVISFDVRYAYNFGQPRDYEERANVNEEGAHFVASSSMDLRLMLGLAYKLDF